MTQYVWLIRRGTSPLFSYYTGMLWVGTGDGSNQVPHYGHQAAAIRFATEEMARQQLNTQRIKWDLVGHYEIVRAEVTGK